MPDYEKTKVVISDAWHIVTFVVLVLALLGVVTWTGLLRCSQIPGWCQVYDPLYLSLTGKKEVLIVYGLEGIGNPELLAQKLRDPNIVGISATLRDVESIGPGNLQAYDLVIVERAKAMSTQQLQYFIDYVDSGGKLVWTGDAGTMLSAEDTPLYKDEVDENAQHVLMSPWARKNEDGKHTVRFDTVISAEYVGNYCGISGDNCPVRNTPIGTLMPESTGDHQLIFGISGNQLLYVNSDPLSKRDFALVKEPESTGSKRVMTLDYGAILKNKEGTEFGRYFPVIITSGIGEKVAYYAQPPEQFLGTEFDPKTGQSRTGQTSLFIANMYKFFRK